MCSNSPRKMGFATGMMGRAGGAGRVYLDSSKDGADQDCRQRSGQVTPSQAKRQE